MAPGDKSFENMIREIAREVVEESQYEMSKAELKAIVYELLPNIDELISKKVKHHLLEIGEFIVSKTKEKGE